MFPTKNSKTHNDTKQIDSSFLQSYVDEDEAISVMNDNKISDDYDYDDLNNLNSSIENTYKV